MTKYTLDGKVNQVRLVEKDYKQKSGIDYFKVFAPIPKLYIFHMIIILAPQKVWKFYQIDIKSVFFNCILVKK